MKTIKVWEENESQYDIGVTWAFLVHAYFLEGKHKKSRLAKEKATSTLNQIKNNDYQLSQGYIHLADCAREVHDISWR